jgi:thioredoxin reductase (NADPH)
MDIIDIAIIGGGPAGLSAALNGIARGKKVRLFSAEGNYLERAERVDNYLGMSNISGTDMMQYFRKQVAEAGVEAETGRVINILPMEKYFMVAFNSEALSAKTVIIASGAARQKEISGESEFLGRGVSYCATCDGMLYRGKKVIVCGEARDLVEEANFLQNLGVSVTVVLPKKRPEKLLPSILFRQSRLTAINGAGVVRSVDLQSGEQETTDGVFILHNSLAPTTLLKGIETQEGFIKVSRLMETNIPGLFAGGDCTGVPLQIAKAVSEGLIAAQQAAKYIDDQKNRRL